MAEREIIALPGKLLTAIDPGPTMSAYMILFEGRPNEFGKVQNEQMLELVRLRPQTGPIVCEQIRSYGMAVGAEVFETVRWSGRFEQIAIDRGTPWKYVPRIDVKMHLCHSAKAKDANIRQALVDRFGGKGTKKAPGALYGVSADVWAALALAVTVWDLRQQPVFVYG